MTLRHFKRVRRSIAHLKARMAMFNLLGRQKEKAEAKNLLRDQRNELKDVREFLR